MVADQTYYWKAYRWREYSTYYDPGVDVLIVRPSAFKHGRHGPQIRFGFDARCGGGRRVDIAAMPAFVARATTLVLKRTPQLPEKTVLSAADVEELQGITASRDLEADLARASADLEASDIWGLVLDFLIIGRTLAKQPGEQACVARWIAAHAERLVAVRDELRHHARGSSGWHEHWRAAAHWSGLEFLERAAADHGLDLGLELDTDNVHLQRARGKHSHPPPPTIPSSHWWWFPATS